MKNKKITLLDLGGVVFQSTGISNSIINWQIVSTLNNKYGYELNIGKNKFPDFLADYNRMTNQRLTGNVFLQNIFDTLEFNRNLIDMVKKVSDIVIVSDNYQENIAYISRRYAFNEWAIKQIYSFDYKMEKSHPLFFKKVLDDLSDYDKEKMLYIDDSPHKLKSAESHEIKGVLYKNNKQISRVLIQVHG